MPLYFDNPLQIKQKAKDHQNNKLLLIQRGQFLW